MSAGKAVKSPGVWREADLIEAIIIRIQMTCHGLGQGKVVSTSRRINEPAVGRRVVRKRLASKAQAGAELQIARVTLDIKWQRQVHATGNLGIEGMIIVDG